MAAEAVDPSEARTRRIGTWLTLLVAIFLPMFVNAITFGWNGHITPRSAKVVMFALWFVLAACAALVAVGIWKNLRRANNPSS
jgi:ABC-type Co2+ transport system permease subunit